MDTQPINKSFADAINSDKPVLVDFFCGMVWPMQNDDSHIAGSEEANG